MQGRERGDSERRREREINEVDEIYIFFLERLLMLPVCNLYYFYFFILLLLILILLLYIFCFFIVLLCFASNFVLIFCFS